MIWIWSPSPQALVLGRDWKLQAEGPCWGRMSLGLDCWDNIVPSGILPLCLHPVCCEVRSSFATCLYHQDAKSLRTESSETESQSKFVLPQTVLWPLLLQQQEKQLKHPRASWKDRQYQRGSEQRRHWGQSAVPRRHTTTATWECWPIRQSTSKYGSSIRLCLVAWHASSTDFSCVLNKSPRLDGLCTPRSFPLLSPQVWA